MVVKWPFQKVVSFLTEQTLWTLRSLLTCITYGWHHVIYLMYPPYVAHGHLIIFEKFQTYFRICFLSGCVWRPGIPYANVCSLEYSVKNDFILQTWIPRVFECFGNWKWQPLGWYCCTNPWCLDGQNALCDPTRAKKTFIIR